MQTKLITITSKHFIHFLFIKIFFLVQKYLALCMFACNRYHWYLRNMSKSSTYMRSFLMFTLFLLVLKFFSVHNIFYFEMFIIMPFKLLIFSTFIINHNKLYFGCSLLYPKLFRSGIANYL